LPETKVEFLSAGSKCLTSTTTEQAVGHYLQLGVVCNVTQPEEGLQFVSQNDSFLECTGTDNVDDVMDGVYTCQSINTFPVNSPEDPIPVPAVVMQTGYEWSWDQTCFQYGGAEESESLAMTTGSPATSPTGESESTTSAPILSIPVATPEPVPASPSTEATEPADANPQPTLSPTNPDPAVTPPPGTTYRVTYKGRFQQVLSPGCIASLPSMVITCAGKVNLLETSDPTIICNTETLTLDDGRDALLCESTCSGDACAGIHLSTGSDGAPYGEITFECHGEDVSDVDGEFIMIEGEPGFCEGSTDATNYGYNVNMGQLAVLCPSDEDETGQSFVIDDLHSDCGIVDIPLKVDGAYTCFTGRTCGTEACQVTFEQLIVNADPHRFPECIESSNGSPVPALDDPAPPSRDDGIYKATFQVLWEFLLDEDDCSGNISPKRIECTNGIISIMEDLTQSCSVIDVSTVECLESAFSTSGGLIYVSDFRFGIYVLVHDTSRMIQEGIFSYQF